jgi:hypothetical protein
MIFTPITTLYHFDTVFYTPTGVSPCDTPDDELYCFYSTKKSLRYYFECGLADDKSRNREVGKDVLCAFYRIKRK